MKIKNSLIKNSIFIALFSYWILLLLGSSLSLPIVVIPDEEAQLLNIYGLIYNSTFKLPYESYYSVWIHYALVPFTLFYWFIEYFLMGMPSLLEFKTHVAANYLDVLPTLRMVSSSLFLLSAWLVSKVIEDRWELRTANLFLLFMVLDLLMFINLHYSKHWIIDFSWLFISIYLYWKYLRNTKKIFLIFAGITFSVAVLSSHPLIVGIFAHFYLFMSNKGGVRDFIKDASFTFIIFLLIFLLTLWLGPGTVISDLLYGQFGGKILSGISLNIISDSILTLFDYNFILTTLLIFSLIYMVLKRDLEIFLLFIPFIIYLLLISTYHFETRYILFLTICMSLICAISISKISKRRTFNCLVGLLVLVNFSLLLTWHQIIIKKDTRQIAYEWIDRNTTNSSFVIYNTLSFNYKPQSTKGINFIKKNFPKAMGTRENLHLSLELPDGVNGIILRKIEEANYSGPKLIRRLIDSGFDPILTNERFGKDAIHFQSSDETFKNILINCLYSTQLIYKPYSRSLKAALWGNTAKNFESYGDILYNFTSVIKSLIVLDRPGPTISIYFFPKNQPSSCS